MNKKISLIKKENKTKIHLTEGGNKGKPSTVDGKVKMIQNNHKINPTQNDKQLNKEKENKNEIK